jgi:hypothetical protein
VETGAVGDEALLSLFAAIDDGHETLSLLHEELWDTMEVEFVTAPE